jgi:hypothetical protein
VTISPEIDFEPFLSVAWLIICLGKSWCSHRRTKSLRVTAFIPRVEPTIRSSFVPIRVTIGNVTECAIHPPRPRFVRALEISNWPAALKAATMLVFGICAPAFVIKALTAFWQRLESKYLSPATPKLWRCGPHSGRTVGIVQEFRNTAIGQTDGTDAPRQLLELLPPPRVLIPRNFQVGFIVP